MRDYYKEERVKEKVAFESERYRVALNTVVELENFDVTNLILMSCSFCGAEIYGYVQEH